ncbi:adhesive domain-containing protein [Companilactobacillus sp. DQM5]|uniref:adhesive domain-containing protein n=1 Tax=Companilactobacillus sp. DQM5 TaxID=3463359 RepID=UPI00405868DA
MEKKLLVKTLYIANGALLLLGNSSGIVAATTVQPKDANSTKISPSSIGLGDISIASNTSLSSLTGTDLTPNSQGNFDLSLKFTGQALASVGVADKKVLVYTLPPELQGKVIGGATVNVDAKLLPITPGEIPGVHELFTALGTAIDGLNAVYKIPSVIAAFNALKNIQSLGSYSETLPATVSADGKSISVDFTDGLGKYIHQAYVALFYPLRDAIDAINVTNPLIKPLVETLQLASDELFKVLDEVANGTSDILNNALSANILGETSGTLNVTVKHPGVAQSTIKAAAINNAVISADILSAINAGGSSVTLNFPMDQNNPLDGYTVNSPTINKITEGDTKVTGHVDLQQPVPEGTTFEAVVTLPDGTEKTVTVDSQGNFELPVDSLKAGDEITVKVTAKNGEFTKDSTPVTATVQAKEISNPLDGYTVNSPTINKITEGDTKVTGHVELQQPVPEGTTFEAVVTLPDGTEKTVTVDSQGNFELSVDPLKAGEEISAVISAKNGEFTKDSLPAKGIVQQKDMNNPLDGYTVNSPTINKITEGDTKVTGHVDLQQPVPEGTTFEAVVRLPDGTEKTVTVDSQGNFELPVDSLKAGDEITVKVTAKNGEFTKDSTPVTATVQAKEVNNPLDGYTVNSPTINKITEGDTKVTGHVELQQPVPEGTTFEAVVTLPDGTEKTVTVDSQGNFELPVDSLKAGDEITVKVTAKNGEFTKDSTPVTATVQAKEISNPLDGYTVNSPTINKITEGDTKVTGHVELQQPVPEGTTFEAVVTLPDGTEKTVTVDSQGNFELPVDSLKAGDEITVKVTAKNGEFTKDSTPVTATVQAKDTNNSLDKYTVAAPIVDPIYNGDTKVTGHVDLQQPIPEGTTFEVVAVLPDGTTKKTTINSDGNFKIDAVLFKKGDKVVLKTVAKNKSLTKDSEKVEVIVKEKSTKPGENPGNGGNGDNNQVPGVENNNSKGNGLTSDSSKAQVRFKDMSNGSGLNSQISNEDQRNTLPNTGEKNSSIWTILGAFMLSIVVFLRKLIPTKK